MNSDDETSQLGTRLQSMVDEMNEDRYMLMEYLGPVVDGCRAALQIDVESAKKLDSMSEREFNEVLNTAGESFQDVAFCITTPESDSQFSVVFEEGVASLKRGCHHEGVVMSAPEDVFLELLGGDSRLSPLDVIDDDLKVEGSDACQIAEALGFLVFPTLLQMARSGIDPSSLHAEDADSVIMTTASDLVTRLLKRWVDIKVSSI